MAICPKNPGRTTINASKPERILIIEKLTPADQALIQLFEDATLPSPGLKSLATSLTRPGSK
jgi:hypothetical protein